MVATQKSYNTHYKVIIILTLSLFCSVLIAGAVSADLNIETSEDLNNFSQTVNNGSSSFIGEIVSLENNLDLSGFELIPIGNETNPFEGTFEGNGHTISNLNITGDYYIGLFGYTNDSTINNLTLKNAHITGQEYIGGLIGYMVNGYVNNCSIRDVLVEGNKTVGGLIGFINPISNNSQITGCSGFGQVSGNSHIGGLIGGIGGSAFECKINDCFASCTVLGERQDIGGLVGLLLGQNNSITHSFTVDNVTGNMTTGGLIGHLEGGSSVDSCVALNAHISGYSYQTKRICGYKYRVGVLSNNSAWDEMEVNDQTVSGDKNDTNGENVSNSDIWSNLDYWKSVFGFDISIDGPTIWHIDIDNKSNPWGVPYLTSQGIPSQQEAEKIQYLNPDTPGPEPTVTPIPHRGGGGGGTTIITSQTPMPTVTPTVIPTDSPIQPTSVSPSAVPTVPATQQQQSPIPIIGILSGLAIGGFLLTLLRK